MALADQLNATGDARGRLVHLAHRHAHEVLDRASHALLTAELQLARATERARWVQTIPLPSGTAFLGEYGFVRGLRITAPPVSGALRHLVDHAETSLLTYVEVEGKDPLQTLRALDDDGILPRLHELVLRRGDLADEGAAWLAEAPSLRALQYLTLERELLDNAGARALAGGLPALRTLDLTGNFIADDGAVSLAGGHWPELTSLILNDNEISDDGIAVLAGASWPHLRELQLQRNEISDDGVLALLAAPSLPRLRILTLASNPLGPRAQQALLTWRAA